TQTDRAGDCPHTNKRSKRQYGTRVGTVGVVPCADPVQTCGARHTGYSATGLHDPYGTERELVSISPCSLDWLMSRRQPDQHRTSCTQENGNRFLSLQKQSVWFSKRVGPIVRNEKKINLANDDNPVDNVNGDCRSHGSRNHVSSV